MTTVTFFIGNGLDIQCGLKTSYNDFYQWLLTKYEIDMSTPERKKESINRVTNIIYQEIFNELCCVTEVKYWADLELALGKYTYNISRQDAQKFMESYEEVCIDLIDYLEQEIANFEISNQDTTRLLYDTMDNFYKGLEHDEELDMNNIMGNVGPINYQVISYNYTDTLEEIILNASNTSKTSAWNELYSQNISREVIHIHGTLSEYMTLGVNDASQLANDIFTEEQLENLIKPDAIKSYRTGRYSRVERAINSSNVIVLFGLSIGDTDREWWRLIARRLLENENNRLIIHAYRNEEYNRSLGSRVKQLRREVENKFVDHLEVPNEQANTIKERTYVVFNSQCIFNINKIM